MADVDLASDLNNSVPRGNYLSRQFEYREVTVDLAAANTTKGSDLAAGDILQVMDIEPRTCVICAGLETVVLPDNDGGTNLTALTFDLGYDGNEDNFVDGYNGLSAAGSTSVPPVAEFHPMVVGSTADTLDLVVKTLTGDADTGKIRVWAILMSTAEIPAAATARSSDG